MQGFLLHLISHITEVYVFYLKANMRKKCKHLICLEYFDEMRMKCAH